MSKLDKGDLIYEVDFREIYANILEDWLDADSVEVLGKGFGGLGLI